MLSIATDIMPLKCILTFKHAAVDIRKLTNLSVAKRSQFKEFLAKQNLKWKKTAFQTTNCGELGQ